MKNAVTAREPLVCCQFPNDMTFDPGTRDRSKGGRKMRKSWVVLASAIALMPASEAFAPGSMGLRLPLSASVQQQSRRGASCGPVMMSDLSDMATEMLSRLNRSGLKDMNEKELEKLKMLCDMVSAKADKMLPSSGAAAAPAPAQAKAAAPTKDAPPSAGKVSAQAFVIGQPANKNVEAEADAYFGLDDGPVDESGNPIEAPKAKAPPPVKTFDLKGTKRFSKYLPDERNVPTTKEGFATVESIVDKEAYDAEYEKVFGRADPGEALTNCDELTAQAPVDQGDPYDIVRKVQGQADQYESSEAYYDALNAAILNWKNARIKAGHAIGSDASNRYIEQLAHSAPNSANYQPWGEKKKFTLDCVLNPIEAQDEDGNAITLLQFTQVDDFGAANRAGASVGEVLVQLNGKNINSFDDLKACIDDINKSKLTSVPIVFQGVNGQRESTITGAPM